MTNREKWNFYNSDLSSPQSFIDWSWRFVVASALQRRVALFGDPKYGHRPLFPNMYVILVGRAGLGKGIVITPATDLLRFHKKKDFNTINATTPDNEKLLIEKIEQANQEDAEAATQQLKRGGERIEPTLFPYAPDATTYEALVEAMGKAGRRINFNYKNGSPDAKLDIYFHCSMYFSLPELGSLFRKRTEDVVNYLLGLYDCPLDYEYKTKTKGCDRVRRGCLSVLAGTTPEFMETVFNQQLIDQGFSSRAFFIYASKNRKNVAIPSPLTEEQKQCRLELLAHIKELAKLYGEIQIDEATKKWIQDWWNNECDGKNGKELSPKLDAYRSRKNIHLYKVAMAEHFGESTSMTIPLERFIEAAEILHIEEKSMHLALSFEGDNPLGKVTDKVLDYIRMNGKANMAEIVTEFWKALPQGKKSAEEVLQYLISSDKIREETDNDKVTGKIVINYKCV